MICILFVHILIDCYGLPIMISGFHYMIYVLFSHYENTNPILMINDLQYNNLLRSVGTVLFIP